VAPIGDFIRRVVTSELRHDSDAELLGRFITARDEAAFAAVVRRHGPMVYRVCRGVLRNAADAEDAAQATFLVLAQQAARVRKRDSLPSWLHGVAFRLARKLRASIARRRVGESDLPVPPRATAEDLTVREAGELLHEELEKLPSRYRGPLVLCYLQGKTHDEAAAELGWTVTAFRGRLERARKHLRDRLGRRGLALGAAPLAVALADASTALPATFVVTTARAAVAGPGAAVAGGLVSPATSRLTQEVLHSMSLAPLKPAGPLALAAALAACGWLAIARTPATPLPAEAPAEAADKPAPADRPDRVLVCCKTRFARLKADRSGLTPVGDEPDDGEFIQRHRISPDGKSVAYLHQTRVGMVLSHWEFDSPWPGKVLSTSFVADFFWMPDGKHLLLGGWGAVKDGLPSDYKFRLFDVATRKAEDLKLPHGHWPADVSPDGKWFLTVRNADPKNLGSGARLYRVEHPGGKARLLFDKVTNLIPPRWNISPDGKQVAGLTLDAGRRLQVFVGDTAGGKLRQATREAPGVSQYFGWSPSGKRLLYAITQEPAKPKDGDAYHELVIAVGADGRGRDVLHDNEGHFKSAPGGKPSKWAPDSLFWADWH
jgi:RNA polymerase sigma factor (sigma-70 family)